ncbi:hypothetical protein QVD17_14436 [Tagetes erecta]|uniref:Uncharacterized protein n=1 Tax=Tagetes erecta TaxID=13708 RepID=A0AAD8KY66_TARER|nr:hypothetical protein QVD17_14436 [Tagetes erecta]
MYKHRVELLLHLHIYLGLFSYKEVFYALQNFVQVNSLSHDYATCSGNWDVIEEDILLTTGQSSARPLATYCFLKLS